MPRPTAPAPGRVADLSPSGPPQVPPCGRPSDGGPAWPGRTSPPTSSGYEAITEMVGRRLGIPTELVVETSYESCADDVNEVCLSAAARRVRAAGHPRPAVPVAPVLQGDRYGGRPIYFSDVIVNRDSRPGPSPTFKGGRGHTTSRCRTRATGSPGTRWSDGRDRGLLRRGHRGRIPRGVDPPGGQGAGGRLRHRLPGPGRGHARRSLTGRFPARHRRPGPVHDPARGRVEAPPRTCGRRSAPSSGPWATTRRAGSGSTWAWWSGSFPSAPRTTTTSG